MTSKTTIDDVMTGVQDLMQVTADGFDNLNTRMDRLEGRMDGLESRMERIERELREIQQRLGQHDVQLAELKQITEELLDKHRAYINDISDILDRIQELEQRIPHITEVEIREMQRLLQTVVDWAIHAAKITRTPIKLPN